MVPGIGGLLLVGVGEGTLLTLLFNVLVSASPKELAGDVGALRGVANNVSSALGSAFAGVVAVGLLGVMVSTALNQYDVPAQLRSEVSSYLQRSPYSRFFRQRVCPITSPRSWMPRKLSTKVSSDPMTSDGWIIYN
jgi:hypothetical protein